MSRGTNPPPAAKPFPVGRPTPGEARAGRTTPSPVSPLIPVLVPLVIAAILSGLLLAWLFPRALPAASTSAPRFADVTASSGVDFTHVPAANPAKAPSTLGGAVVCLDYDGDGAPDLFFVNGTVWPWEDAPPDRLPSRCALFHNDGKGHFTNVSHAAGIDIELQGMSAAAGDYDNDGRPDLFITAVGMNRLFHNRGDGTFEEVTETAGVGGDENTWSTGAAWIDFDGDGLLDLVVCHYAHWSPEQPLQAAFTIAEVGRSYGAPTGFISIPPSLYRNLGHGRFALVPGSGGLRNIDRQTGLPAAKGLTVVPVDANGDGRLDLLFSYQAADNALFLNQGDGTFRQWSAGRDDRHEGAAPGLLLAGSLSLAQQNGADERSVSLRAASAWKPAAAEPSALSLPGKFGAVLFDYDHDGQLELFSGEGRAEADISRFEAGRDFAARPLLYWNRGDNWVPVNLAVGDGSPLLPMVARGVASADFDGDGNVDVIIAQDGGRPMLLRNDQRRDLPWLQIDLVATRGPRAGDGARVEVHTPRRILVQTMAPAMGFMAQSASTLAFGLGEDARVRKIVVQWPDGTRQELRPEGVNRRIVIREP
jgi:hypothetical protein